MTDEEPYVLRFHPRFVEVDDEMVTVRLPPDEAEHLHALMLAKRAVRRGMELAEGIDVRGSG